MTMAPRPSALDRVRHVIRELSGYYDAHPNAKVKVKLDQNENAYDFPDELKLETFERARAERWERYYAGRPPELLGELSALTDWPAAGIIVGNGSNELLMATLLATAAVGGRVLIVQPSFLLYGRLCRILGAEIVGVPLDAHLAFDPGRIRRAIERIDPSLVLICSPNNPTGASIDPAGLRTILDGYAGVALIDEAYHEFSGTNCRWLLDEYDNVVLLRTFSKAMSLAGLRVGYLLGQPPLVEEILKAKLPFSLNPLSCQAALTALRHRTILRSRVETIVAERDRVLTTLRAQPGIVVYPSDANFILLRVPGRGDAVIADLAERGVRVRKLRGHPLLEDSLRVSVGTPGQNDHFLTALEASLAANV